VTSNTLSTPTTAASSSGDPADAFPVTSAEGVLIIEPGRFRFSLWVRDLLAYRELLYFLTWRDVKIRYKQTLLGAAWAILQPLLTMLIFTVLFGRLAGIKSDVPYPLFAYSGLVIWTFFSNAITNSGNSLVGSAHLITKIYFPRMFVPAGAIAAGLVDFALAFVIQIGLMFFYRVHPSWAMLMVLPLVFLATLLAFGFGMWLSALNVKYRDIRYAIPFLLQLWMFASPIIYPVNSLPPRWRWALMLNPLTGIIDNFRIAIFGNHEFEWKSLAATTIITAVVLIYAAFSFSRMERQFADII
jgi:homopolymeric O-antigen transport system permease protein